MRHTIKETLTFRREGSVASESPMRGEAPLRTHAPVEVPVASLELYFPAKIPEERLDYYAWVFHQRGFSGVQMTFEQFLAVVAAVNSVGQQKLKCSWMAASRESNSRELISVEALI